MAETVDELTVTYEDGGIETVKELDKKRSSIFPAKIRRKPLSRRWKIGLNWTDACRARRARLFGCPNNLASHWRARHVLHQFRSAGPMLERVHSL